MEDRDREGCDLAADVVLDGVARQLNLAFGQLVIVDVAIDEKPVLLVIDDLVPAWGRRVRVCIYEVLRSVVDHRLGCLDDGQRAALQAARDAYPALDAVLDGWLDQLGVGATERAAIGL